uniref:Uncharacterized protein n=1 Tax=Rhizophora mucronata TaxID=61149 RepID=A0A2P2P6M0_RHIMU
MVCAAYFSFIFVSFSCNLGLLDYLQMREDYT